LRDERSSREQCRDNPLPLGGLAEGAAQAGPATPPHLHRAADARACLSREGLPRADALARERAADLHSRRSPPILARRRRVGGRRRRGGRSAPYSLTRSASGRGTGDDARCRHLLSPTTGLARRERRLSAAYLKLAGSREPVEDRGDLEEQPDHEVLERPRALEPAEIHRFVAGVADQLLCHLARLLVGRVQAARRHPLGADLIEEPPGIRIESLRDGTVRECLHLVRERLVLLVAARKRIRGVNRDLAFEARYLAECLRDRARWNGDENDVGIRSVAAVAPERGDLVSRLFPEAGEPA